MPSAVPTVSVTRRIENMIVLGDILQKSFLASAADRNKGNLAQLAAVAYRVEPRRYDAKLSASDTHRIITDAAQGYPSVIELSDDGPEETVVVVKSSQLADLLLELVRQPGLVAFVAEAIGSELMPGVAETVTPYAPISDWKGAVAQFEAVVGDGKNGISVDLSIGPHSHAPF
jgi:hypothetical protein